MTDHDTAAPPPDVADVLAAQAEELAALHKELIASYEKELKLLANQEKRDRESKQRDDERLKKIWWLESQLRTRQNQLGKLQTELERTRSSLHNLQRSPMGRVQRSYWKMRQGARR